MNSPRVRAVVSLLLVVLFVLVAITGIGLIYAPRGRWAAGWTFLGADRHTLEAIHTYAGLLMAVIVIIHLALNWRMLKSEIQLLLRKS